MKMETSELEGTALDWAVAKALYGDRLVHYRTWLETTNNYWKGKDCSFAPSNEYRILSKDFDGVTTQFIKPYSTDWSQGGPIIEQEKIIVDLYQDNGWCCLMFEDENAIAEEYGPTPLVAAMRCYVASKLGDEVEVPDLCYSA